jgi:hypothetical protein
LHASDDTPLSEFLIDTAVVRGTIDGRNDERFVRGRMASFVSVLGMALIVFFAASWPSWEIAAVGLPVLVVVAVLIAEPRLAPEVMSRLRRPQRRSGGDEG